MRITIKEVKTFKENNYDRVFLIFERDGKTQERKLARVGKNIKAFDTLQKATAGQAYDVKLEKSPNGNFWDWVDIEVAGESSGSGTNHSTGSTGEASKHTSRSMYETPEERTLRQLHIVRQSSLATAERLVSNGPGKTKTVEEVISVAQKLVDFVYNGTEEDKAVEFD